MKLRTILTACAVVILAAACREQPRQAPPVKSETPTVGGGGAGSPNQTLKAASDRNDRAALGQERRLPGSCWTLLDAEEPDVLRLAKDGLVLYANAQVGLVIIDASDPDNPRHIATSSFTGTPIATFEREGGAIVVFAPWDRPSETRARAVDLTPRSLGRTIGEIVLTGGLRDARRVGDVIVVTRDIPALSDDPAGALPRTAVTTLTLDDASGFMKRDELRFTGRGALVGGTPFGIVVAREAEASSGADRTAVTWISVSNEGVGTGVGVGAFPGALHLHGTQVISGVLPRWRNAADHMIDVSEDARVRLLACSSAACPAGDDATYAAIDFAMPDQPRLIGWSMLARAGDGVFRFKGEDLVVARPPPPSAAGRASESESTEIAFFHASSELVPAGTVRVRGLVGSIALRDPSDVITLGWTGSAAAGRRALVHQIRFDDGGGTRRSLVAAQVVGSTTFGGDWTWTPAYDDDRAMSFDPTSTFAALPMTTMRRDRPGVTTAVQVLSFGPKGPPTSIAERDIDLTDRLLFIDGRLLAFSANGVAVVNNPGERVMRKWDDLPTVVR